MQCSSPKLFTISAMRKLTTTNDRELSACILLCISSLQGAFEQDRIYTSAVAVGSHSPRMLQLLARRLRGIPSSPSLPLPATCERCRIATDKYALIHTSAISRWRTREERRLALHSNDDEYNSLRSRRRRNHDAEREDDRGRQHHARPSYPRRRTSLDSHRPAEHPRRPQRDYERRPREYERPAREGLYSPSLFPIATCFCVD